jgi:hypothetical protein
MRKSWVALHSHPETQPGCDSRIGKQSMRHAGALGSELSDQEPRPYPQERTRAGYSLPSTLTLYFFK